LKGSLNVLNTINEIQVLQYDIFATRGGGGGGGGGRMGHEPTHSLFRMTKVCKEDRLVLEWYNRHRVNGLHERTKEKYKINTGKKSSPGKVKQHSFNDNV